ncbi:MAG: lytic transglycosylase domain-containing protein [Acidobacteria bacterium]|nr:lytic transglycosylase domain-containing protein [Acidobacteriota bacterium]
MLIRMQQVAYWRIGHSATWYSSVFVFLLLASYQVVRAKPVHSYVDEHGVLVYFNVPHRHMDIGGDPAALPEEIVAEASEAPTSIISTSPARMPIPSRYDGYISKHASNYAVDPDLVRAVMVAESGFNPVAVSRRGAVGLMQLIPSTARRFGVRDLFQPEQNIEGGVKYLRFLLDTFDNDLKLALAAYNAGENVVKRLGGVPNYRETITYVRKILALYGDSYRPYRATTPLEMSAGDVHEIPRIYRIVDLVNNVVVYTNRPTSLTGSD